MSAVIIDISDSQLRKIGIKDTHINYQLPAEELMHQALQHGEGVLNSTNALCINTGAFTGRSPKDKFTVLDATTKDSVFWNNFNIPIDEKYFLQLKEKLIKFLNRQDEIWIRDCYACADKNYRLNIRAITETPACSLFTLNMF